MSTRRFTLDDLRLHFQNLQMMGMKNMMGRMPGMAEMAPDGEDPDVVMRRVAPMIDAMTADERTDPSLIDAGRRIQIAEAADVQPPQVAKFLEQFAMVRALMDPMMSMSVWQRILMVLGFRRFRPPANPPA